MGRFASSLNTAANAAQTPALTPAQPQDIKPEQPQSPNPEQPQSSNPEYKFDPIAAASAIKQRMDAGLLQSAVVAVGDVTYLCVTGNEDTTKAMKGKFKGLGARWSPDHNGWLMQPDALTNPEAAAAAKDERVAARQARKNAKTAKTDTNETKAEAAAKPADGAKTIALRDSMNITANAIKTVCPFITPDAIKQVVEKLYADK